jgi:hypothetical protein
MATKLVEFQRGYDAGYDVGYKVGWEQALLNSLKVQQQFYDLTPHDLDTLSMGLALLVLHAADIETIASTMGTQQKLGIAEKTLGWLHCICTNATEYTRQFSLREGEVNPWLHPGAAGTDDSEREPRLRDWSEQDNGLATVEEPDDEIPF